MKKLTLAAAASILAMSGTAIYAAAPKDANGDGNVTRTEAVAKANEMWTKLDVNNDGVLNQADRDAKRGQMFDRLDANKDGSISRDEFMAAHGPRGEHAGMNGEGREGRKGGGMHRGRHGGGMGMMMVRMADADKDGSVTRAEYDAAVTRHFDMVDTNKDGTITKAERQAAHAKIKGMKGMHRGGMDHGDTPPPPGA
jgi:hypothetical protein